MKIGLPKAVDHHRRLQLPRKPLPPRRRRARRLPAGLWPLHLLPVRPTRSPPPSDRRRQKPPASPSQRRPSPPPQRPELPRHWRSLLQRPPLPRGGLRRPGAAPLCACRRLWTVRSRKLLRPWPRRGPAPQQHPRCAPLSLPALSQRRLPSSSCCRWQSSWECRRGRLVCPGHFPRLSQPALMEHCRPGRRHRSCCPRSRPSS